MMKTVVGMLMMIKIIMMMMMMMMVLMQEEEETNSQLANSIRKQEQVWDYNDDDHYKLLGL